MVKEVIQALSYASSEALQQSVMVGSLYGANAQGHFTYDEIRN